jgi:hypothetical protein
MPSTRWRFSNRENPNQTIIVDDPRSAQVLSELLGSFAPGAWVLQEEVVLGGDRKSEPPVARAPAAPAPAKAPVAPVPAVPPVMAAPAALAPAEGRRPVPVVPERPAKVSETSKLFGRSGQTKVSTPAPPVVEARSYPEIPEAVIEKERSALLKKRDVAEPEAPAPGKVENKRKHRRFSLEFKVILIADGRTFRSFSDNISIGGMALKHKIPETMLNKNCRIIISRSDSLENIEFSCRIHGGPNDARRLEFVDCDPATVASLEKWIQNSGASLVSRVA